MKTLRIVCNFLLSLVQALFPRGLKGRHSCPGDPVAGADSTVVASSEADGGGAGSHRRDLVDHPSGESAGGLIRHRIRIRGTSSGNHGR